MAKALLVVADIGGYTRFMKVHRINLAHAQDIVARLLEAVIDASKLKLAKLEGDAAFFYAAAGNGQPDVVDDVRRIRSAFARKKHQMMIERLCSCEGCTQVSDLTLKFAVHRGEVAVQKVKSYVELAGLDVILVHRLLKNTVPVREYLLATEELRAEMPADLPLTSSTEELEGIGPTPVFWVTLEALAPLGSLQAPPASGPRRALSWAGMTWRALPYMTGLKKACDGFQNLELGPSSTSSAVLGGPRGAGATADDDKMSTSSTTLSD
ncbi:MAG: DUF2652 domain-containing protein [Deltaproteobacteria bacterium]|nr:DUF2652 domain-containing protein [Deltaproteobacteria bacterium]